MATASGNPVWLTRGGLVRDEEQYPSPVYVRRRVLRLDSDGLCKILQRVGKLVQLLVADASVLQAGAAQLRAVLGPPSLERPGEAAHCLAQLPIPRQGQRLLFQTRRHRP